MSELTKNQAQEEETMNLPPFNHQQNNTTAPPITSLNAVTILSDPNGRPNNPTNPTNRQHPSPRSLPFPLSLICPQPSQQNKKRFLLFHLISYFIISSLLFFYLYSQVTTLIPRIQFYVTLRENRCLVHQKSSLQYYCDINICHLLFFNVTYVDRIVVDPSQGDGNETIGDGFLLHGAGGKLQVEEEIGRMDAAIGATGVPIDLFHDGEMARSEDEEEECKEHATSAADSNCGNSPSSGQQPDANSKKATSAPSTNHHHSLPLHGRLQWYHSLMERIMDSVLYNVFSAGRRRRRKSGSGREQQLPQSSSRGNDNSYNNGNALHQHPHTTTEGHQQQHDADTSSTDPLIDPTSQQKHNLVIMPTTSEDFEAKNAMYQVNQIYTCYYDAQDRNKIIFQRPNDLWLNLLLSIGFAVILTVYMVGVPLFVIRRTAGWHSGGGYGTRMTEKMRSFFGMYSRYQYLEQ